MAAKIIKGLNLSIGLDASEFKATLGELKRDVSMATDNVKTFQRVLKNNPNDPNALKGYKSALEELSNIAKTTRDKLSEVFDEALKQNVSPSDSRVRSLVSYMNQLDTVLKKTIPSFEEFNGKVDEGSDSVDALTIALGNLGADAIKSVLNGIKSIIGGIVSLCKSAISGIYELTKTGIEYNASIETYRASISAMLGGEVDAQKQADSLISAMKGVAKQSSFTSEALLDSVTQLIASGISADDAQKQITALAKALAYAGKGDDELKRMAQNLNQIQNAGKATAADLKQFAYAGLPIYKLLAEYSEKFANGVDSKTNPATYEDIANAILQATAANGKFFDAFTIQSNTLQGQMTKLESNWTEFLGTLTEDATSIITTDILPTINTALEEIQKAYQNAQVLFNETGKTFDTSQLEDVMGMDYFYKVLSQQVENVINAFTNEDFLESITNVLTIIINALDKAFDPNTEQGERNRQALYNLIDTIVDFVVKILTDEHIVTTIKNAIVTIIDALSTSISEQIEYKLKSKYGEDFQFVSGSYMHSGGFGDLQNGLQSGGFSSGGITLNTTFNLSNTTMDDYTANRFARIMADKINDELGRMV